MTFREMITESIVDTKKLKSKEGSKTEKEKGKTTIRGYIKSSTYSSKTNYYSISKKDIESITEKLKNMLKSKVKSLETSFDDGETFKKIDTNFSIGFFSDNTYDVVNINVERGDDRYYSWGFIKDLDKNIDEILSIVADWSKEEIFLYLEDKDISILNSINKGKSTSESFLIKINIAGNVEYEMSRNFNKPKNLRG